MEFLKKNWGKLTIAILSLIGFILMLIATISLADLAPKFKFASACQYLGPMIFFLGIAVYYACKMLDQKSIAKWVLLGTGAVVTLLLVIGMFGDLTLYGGKVFDGFKKPYGSFKLGSILAFPYLGQLIVFGLMPLVKGIAQVVHCDSQKSKPAAAAKTTTTKK